MRRHAKVALGIAGLCSLFAIAAAPALADTAPTVTIDPAGSVTYTSAHLSGAVNPQGGPSTTYWQLQTSTSGEAGSWNVAAAGEFAGTEAEQTSAQTVEADATGLAPGGFYFVRLVAANEGGEAISAKPSFVTEAVAAPALVLDAPTAVTAGGAHFSGTINPEAPEAAPTSAAVEAGFGVNWRFECNPACLGMEGNLAADNAAHTVEADATGLKPGTEYEVTLVGKNAGEPVSAGPETFTTAPVAPQIAAVNAIPLASEANIDFKLNPGGTQASYLVQYGLTPALGSSSVTKTAPAGSVPVSASVNLTGLSAGSTYYFKVIATSAVGSSESATDTFTMTSGDAMCPCWNYQLVSPQEKTHSDVNRQTSSVVAAEDGSRVSYTSTGGIANPGGLPSVGQTLSVRTGTGWQTRSLNPYQEPNSIQVFGVAGFAAFSPSLTKGVFSAFDPALTPDAEGKVNSLYLTELGLESDSYTLLSKSAEPLPPPLFATREKSFSDASNDWTKFVFQSPRALTPDAPQDEEFFKVYSSHNGAVQLVSILPDGSVPVSGAVVGAGAAGAVYTGSTMSADGRTIFFTANPDPQSGYGQIYARVDGMETIHISASQRTTPDPAGVQPSLFWDSSPDGRYVFFTSTEKLTDDATANTSSEVGGADLYRYDLDSDQLEDLTTSDPNGAEVEAVLGTASGGGIAYFAARKNLAPGGQAGRRNIYRWEQSEGVSYVGRLTDSGREATNWSREPLQGLQRSSRVGTDGKSLVFTSEADQTTGEEGPAQIYLYEEGGGVTCISCGGKEPAEVGSATFNVDAPSLVRVIGYLPRNLSSSGIVFFNTAESLVSNDTNGQTDVYAYRQGRAELVSDGHSPYAAYFADADADGTNVFILTRNRLRASDRDENVDLYDATQGPWAERDTPAPPFIPCSGEACQSPALASPLSVGPQLGSSNAADVPKPRHRRAAKKPRVCAKQSTKKKRAHCKSKKSKSKKSSSKKRGK